MQTRSNSPATFQSASVRHDLQPENRHVVDQAAIAPPPLDRAHEQRDALFERLGSPELDHLEQLTVAELVPLGIHRLGNAVGIETEPVARLQLNDELVGVQIVDPVGVGGFTRPPGCPM